MIEAVVPAKDGRGEMRQVKAFDSRPLLYLLSDPFSSLRAESSRAAHDRRVQPLGGPEHC